MQLTHAAVIEAAADACLPWILVGHFSSSLLESVDLDTPAHCRSDFPSISATDNNECAHAWKHPARKRDRRPFPDYYSIVHFHTLYNIPQVQLLFY